VAIGKTIRARTVRRIEDRRARVRIRKIRIEIPALPPREASPNWRGHWTARYRGMRDYKTLVAIRARQAMRANPTTQPLPAARIDTTLVVRDNRYIMDGDNAIASLKAGIDGLVEAGILQDDKDIRVSPVFYDVDKTRAPMTIFHVVPIRKEKPIDGQYPNSQHGQS